MTWELRTLHLAVVSFLKSETLMASLGDWCEDQLNDLGNTVKGSADAGYGDCSLL